MKKYLLIVTMIVMGFTACENSKKTETTLKTNNEISFEGVWSRSFDLGNDSIQDVFYRIWKDSIQYEMKGPLNLNYTLQKDTFLAKDNRWIGKLYEQDYVVFVKNVTSDSIAIFKKKIKSSAEGLSMPFPSDTAMSRFSPWNTYYLKK